MWILRIFIVIAMLLLFAATVHSAGQNDSTITWVSPSTTSIQASLGATRCMNSTGSQNLIVSVLKIPSVDPDLAASVTALVTRPDGDTNNITFSSQGDGNYSINFDFNVNGTYKLEFSASDTQVNSTHDFNEYIYVKDFNIRVSFLNNSASYNPGDTVTIRAQVLNTDNNAFNDLNSSISVFYPNTTTLVSGEQMSGLGNGEYIYSLIARSTAGTYSATASFSCNDESDSNALGRFIVQNSGTSTTSTSSSGGGGGGWAPTSGIRDFDAKILGYNFDKKPNVGDSSKLNVKFSNTGLKTESYLVTATITAGKDTFYSSMENIQELLPNEKKEIVFAEAFNPSLAGTNIIRILVYSSDKRTLYAELIEEFDIEGLLRYDVSIDCLDSVVKRGSEIKANISLLNLGNYYQDIKLDWWVEDSNGVQIKRSSMPIALYSNESRSILRSIFITADSESGEYLFNAEVIYGKESKKGSCAFIVEREEEFYPRKLNAFERQLNELESTVFEDEKNGYQTNSIKEEISKAREKISNFRMQLLSGNSAELDKGLAMIEEELNTLLKEEKNLEKGKAFFSVESGQTVTFTFFMIVIYLLIFIGVSYNKYKRKKPFGDFLGFQSYDKTEKILKERKKEKEKGNEENSVFEKLFGFK